MAILGLSEREHFVRVNFTNRGLGKIFKKESNLSNSTPDKKDVVKVGEILSDVKIPRGSPVVFRTIPEFLGINYIGYIIEKERLDKKTGEWHRIDEFRIIGSSSNSFIDTRVAYGEFYRYRMKSIIKLTKAEKKVSLSHLEVLQDVQAFQEEQIKKKLDKNKLILQNLDQVTNLGLTNKSSGGQQSKEIQLDNGILLKANADTTEIFKESTLKSENLRLLQNLRVSDVGIARGDLNNSDLQALINDNLEKLVELTTTYSSAYYESSPTKNWIYVDVVENEPPPPPQTIKITPNSPKKQIIVSWLKPANSQRDIKFYKLYRREGVGFDWELVQPDGSGIIGPLDKDAASKSLIPINQTLVIDSSVSFGKSYVYALACVDVHGTESFLSVQVSAELNSNYTLEKQEKPLKWVSGSGVRPDEINYIVKKFLNRTEQLIAKRSIFIAPSTKFAETKKDLIIKVKSLDTHETHEIKVSLINANITERGT